MAVKPPNYTQVPNEFLDHHMSALPASAFKVLMHLTRVTMGWHREVSRKRDTSISATARRTGLSRPTVIKAYDELVALDLAVRHPSGRGNSYSLAVRDDKELSPPRTIGQESLPMTGQESLPQEKKPSERDSPPNGGEVPGQREFVGAMAAACGLDTSLMTATARIVLTRHVKVLRDHGVTLDELAAARDSWGRDDWRGRRGDSPTPAQMVDHVGKCRASALFAELSAGSRLAEKF